MSTYSEKLKDPRWQKKRLEILDRDKWKCRLCGNKKLSLHVHHTCYLKNLSPWEYEEHQLLSLCEDCHDIEHIDGGDYQIMMKKMFGEYGLPPKVMIICLKYLLETEGKEFFSNLFTHKKLKNNMSLNHKNILINFFKACQ